MQKNTGTILRIYLLAETKPGKQEGVVNVWKQKANG